MTGVCVGGAAFATLNLGCNFNSHYTTDQKSRNTCRMGIHQDWDKECIILMKWYPPHIIHLFYHTDYMITPSFKFFTLFAQRSMRLLCQPQMCSISAPLGHLCAVIYPYRFRLLTLTSSLTTNNILLNSLLPLKIPLSPDRWHLLYLLSLSPPTPFLSVKSLPPLQLSLDMPSPHTC